LTGAAPLERTKRSEAKKRIANERLRGPPLEGCKFKPRGYEAPERSRSLLSDQKLAPLRGRAGPSRSVARSGAEERTRRTGAEATKCGGEGMRCDVAPED
jgi:hypothetical protein